MNTQAPAREVVVSFGARITAGGRRPAANFFRRATCRLLRAAFYFGLLGGVVAAQGAAPLEAYRERVKQAHQLVEEGDAETFDAEARELLLRLLPEQETVVHEGRAFQVNNAWLAAEVKQLIEAKQPEKEQIYARLAGRLGLLAGALDRLGATGEPRFDDEQARLREILSRRDFAIKRGPTLMERAWQWVIEQLAKLFDLLPSRGKAFDRVLRWVIIAVAVAVALLAVVLLARHFRRERKATPEPKRVIFGEEITEETTAESLVEAARRLAQGGDFRGAIRKLYVSLLLEFDRRGLLRLQASVTNREYLNRLRQQVSLFPLMSHLTDRFDYFWYGKFASSEADFNDFFANYRRALESVKG